MLEACVVIVLLLLILGSFKSRYPSREHYGAANEPHAGLNPALSLDAAPGHGWPGFYLSGYRGDSASSLSHMMMRD
jgi:hypothetical protein